MQETHDYYKHYLTSSMICVMTKVPSPLFISGVSLRPKFGLNEEKEN